MCSETYRKLIFRKKKHKKDAERFIDKYRLELEGEEAEKES